MGRVRLVINAERAESKLFLATEVGRSEGIGLNEAKEEGDERKSYLQSL